MASSNNTAIVKGIDKLKPVKDKKKLPPMVEHKVLTKEEKRKRKREALNKAKVDLAKLNTGGK